MISSILFSLRECTWEGPLRKQRYYEGRNDDDKEDNNIEVEVDTRNDLCLLTIRRVRVDHQGPWKCIAEDDNGDEDEVYVFLKVAGASRGGRPRLKVSYDYTKPLLK